MGEVLFEFEKFDIYKRALDFANDIYDLTKKYPKSEQFGLVSQLRRASISVVSNIAEGYGKYKKKEKTYYYRIARGSAHECVPQLTISLKQEFIPGDDFNELYQTCFELARRLSGLINSIKQRN